MISLSKFSANTGRLMYSIRQNSFRKDASLVRELWILYCGSRLVGSITDGKELVGSFPPLYIVEDAPELTPYPY